MVTRDHMIDGLIDIPLDRSAERADGGSVQLRAWLAQADLAPGTKLPAERQLSELLGVSRGDLRKALAELERDGALWRHVGKGTFVGAKPAEELVSIRDVAAQSNPGEVMHARILLEPLLASEAALNASAQDVKSMENCLQAARNATSWRQYETCDNGFHRALAEATKNTVLIALYDQLNAIRRTVVWGRLRVTKDRPPIDHHSFAEHERIFDAIAHRDRGAAAEWMRAHLETVRMGLLETA